VGNWTRVVVIQCIIPIRIDPNAPDEEAIQKVKDLFIERNNGVINLDQCEYFVPSEAQDDDPDSSIYL